MLGTAARVLGSQASTSGLRDGMSGSRDGMSGAEVWMLRSQACVLRSQLAFRDPKRRTFFLLDYEKRACSFGLSRTLPERADIEISPKNPDHPPESGPSSPCLLPWRQGGTAPTL